MSKNIYPLLLLLACAALIYACRGAQGSSKRMPLPYNEAHRPQYHFSPARQWTNDPNGMVYYEGEYHLFYQHYPDSNIWGPMHWAHAVSKDMVHWEHLPIAIYPDSLGYIFSGSAVVDWSNSSGFGKNGKPPLVAIFTYHNMPAEKAGKKDCENQGIAYSNDKGRTWIKYEKNPVLRNTGMERDFRDPKLIWHQGTQKWIVTLAVGDHAEFWASPDLKNWTRQSEFGRDYGAHGGVWECPDLFQMTLQSSDSKNVAKKWVLLISVNPGGYNGGSSTQYFVGDFDGKTFVPDAHFAQVVPKGKAVWLDYGKDNYAGVTWSDIPETDGRRILVGWMSNWEYANIVPTKAWRNAITLPRELILKNSADGYRLFTKPVKELENLRGKSYTIPAMQISPALDLSKDLGFSPAQSEWILEFDLSQASSVAKFGVELSNSAGENYRIGYDAAAKKFFSDRTKAGDASFSPSFANSIHFAPRASSNKTLRMHLFFDQSSAELFADDGSVVMTEIYFPKENFSKAGIFSEGGKMGLNALKIWQMKGIWPKK